MKYITKTVTLDTAEIVDESRSNSYQLKGDVWKSPDVRLKYTAELCRQKFPTFSVNQKYSIGSCAGIMLKDGKCELLYDSVFFSRKTFNLDNPAVSLNFFGGKTVTEMKNLNYFILKKGLKCEKKRRAALKGNPKSIKSKALIIQRKSFGEWQINAKGYVRFKLTLLVKNGDDYFLTTFSDWDKTERFSSILEHAFDLSVDEIIPVIYNPDNPADIMPDYDNIKPFSFKHIPQITLTEPEQNNL